MYKNKKAFTIIELLVVVAIIGLLATLVFLSFSNSRARSRDSARLSDVNRIRQALNLYWQASGVYPSEGEFVVGDPISYGGVIFMEKIPTPPEPFDDGDCDEDVYDEYIYTTSGSGGSMTYELEFCLGFPSGGLNEGEHIASPSGISPK